ncbi:MAG: hypothetical protein U5J62_08905 [Desulfurivibrio sp.]|nr:hypothetical protein [Desulfurivibrio sp.]
MPKVSTIISHHSAADCSPQSTRLAARSHCLAAAAAVVAAASYLMPTASTAAQRVFRRLLDIVDNANIQLA